MSSNPVPYTHSTVDSTIDGFNGNVVDKDILNETEKDHFTSVREEGIEVEAYDERMPESLRALTEQEREALSKQVVRKADLVIIPIVAVLYILNYIDRQNLSAAKLQGIMEDLNMTTQEFATSISILFVSYLPFQVPSNLLIASIPRPGLYITCAVVIWGGISAATAAIKTYHQLLALRILLGAVEAVFFPGVIYLLSAWYTKKELGLRIAGLYIGQQIGNAFGGLIAAGCLKLAGRHGMAGWQWLFLIEGVSTVGLGLIFSLFLPEYPHNARMLTRIQRDMAVWRIEREAGSAEGSEKVGTWEGFKIGFKDIKLYALVFCNMMGQAMGSIANFFPTIVKTLGFNSINTLLLTAPPYVFAAGFYVVLMWYSGRKNTIYPLIMGCICLAIVTYVISMSTLNLGARYFAMMLMPCSSVGPQLLLYATINSHLSRPVAKRAAAVALLNSVGGTSNIWASYLWYEGPYYYAAFGCLIACAGMFMLTITAYRWHVRNENKKLDQGGGVAEQTLKRGVTREQLEMGWRYEGF